MQHAPHFRRRQGRVKVAIITKYLESTDMASVSKVVWLLLMMLVVASHIDGKRGGSSRGRSSRGGSSRSSGRSRSSSLGRSPSSSLGRRSHLNTYSSRRRISSRTRNAHRPISTSTSTSIFY
ncbi:unnamed protein product [Meganyctiphanes norvegica]|uniref:Uncharacterized protein n=1 Tax=Meganyctiphanes norvegica TaxID=48144 RepID=A0AAV2PWM5_MEGNR